MSTVKSDLVSESSLTRTRHGYAVVRVYSVGALDPISPLDPKYQAMLTVGVPQYGEYHPTIPGLRVEEVQAVPQGATIVHVHIHYATPGSGNRPPQLGDAARLSISSVTTESRLNSRIDSNGNPEAFVVKDPTADSNTTPEKQVVTLRVFSPQIAVRLLRRETEDPVPKAKTYVGSINSNTFRNFDAKTLMCVAINAETDDAGKSYLVTYDFQYAPNGWVSTAHFIDPQTNRPKLYKNGDVPEPATFDVFPAKDFGILKLA